MHLSVIKTKSFSFSLSIISVYKHLSAEKREFILSKQMLRSGTAIGALYSEAEYAESRSDFIHKLSIALKEANETLYWLDLLHQSDYLKEVDYISLNNQCTELVRLLSSSIKTSKLNMRSK